MKDEVSMITYKRSAQFVSLEQRLEAFKEESKDFWAKNKSPPATVEQLRAIRETWMASQKRVAKLEQLQDSII